MILSSVAIGSSVDGLEPDTVYRYSARRWDARAVGPVANRQDRARIARVTLRFLYLGDAQTGLEGWGRLLKAAYRRHPGLDFILLAGDLVDRGNERTNWDHFFLRAAGVFDRVPLMPCVGNHEYLDMGPRLYRAFFELPRNGPSGIDPDLVYHFECGDACFAVLDSTLAVCDPDQARRQAEWLDATLKQTKASWKFVIFHHPVYPSHPWRDTPALREHWVPIFDKHHVDLVLQGHDHAYQRTYPLRAHQRVDEPGDGTIYLIAVSGDKFVDQAPRDYIEVGPTRRVDLSDLRHRRAIEPPDLPRLDRGRHDPRRVDHPTKYRGRSRISVSRFIFLFFLKSLAAQVYCRLITLAIS